jgi:O-methyltransferase
MEVELKLQMKPAGVRKSATGSKWLLFPAAIGRKVLKPWWTVVALLRTSVGKQYGIQLTQKLTLVRKLWRNGRHPGSATSFFEHVRIVTRLLQIPAETPGVVGEFGCYKGFSTASLSLACALTKRRLVVFDSFEGLPEHTIPISSLYNGELTSYKQGQYCGALEEVRDNVKRYGALDVCEFVEGFFDDTLPNRDVGEYFVCIFEDADLPESVRSVLRHTWRKLQPGSVFFCHEARDQDVVEIFFDRAWWADNLGEPAPGFVGSGVGVMSGPDDEWCCLGYTVRRART